MRELFNIPIVGMTEAALVASGMVGATYSLLTFGDRATHIYREICYNSGLGSRLVSIRSLPMLSELEKRDPLLLVGRIVNEIEIAIERDRCESIILAGAIFGSITEEVQAHVAIPVLNGIRESVGLIEMLVRSGIRKAAVGSYAPLDGRVISWPIESIMSYYRNL